MGNGGKGLSYESRSPVFPLSRSMRRVSGINSVAL